MDFVFNELSTRNLATSVDGAHFWLDTFFRICIKAGNRSNQSVSIVSTIKFSGIHYHDDTSFAMWIGTIDDVDFKRRVLTMITKEPIRVDYPYYYFQKVPCQGLGFAYEKGYIGVSYAEEHWTDHKLSLLREQFDDNENVETKTLTVRHIASEQHLDVYFPVRKFTHNRKHDRVRPIANKGEEVSILECSTERACELLCYSIGENTASDKQLYFYDSEVRKFIVFYRHDINLNEYHAYHTNKETELPPSILKELKTRYNL